MDLVPRNSMDFHGFPWNPMEFLGPIRPIQEAHGSVSGFGFLRFLDSTVSGFRFFLLVSNTDTEGGIFDPTVLIFDVFPGFLMFFLQVFPGFLIEKSISQLKNRFWSQKNCKIS